MPKYVLELRVLTVSPHYERIEVGSSTGGTALKLLLQLSSQETVFIRLTDTSSGIIMQNVLLVSIDSVATLPKHGNHYLEFPW